MRRTNPWPKTPWRACPASRAWTINWSINGEQPAEHSDAWITTKVKTALLFHRNVSGTGTTVYTKDGVVTLQGVANSMAQKELTTEYAKDIDNVKSVKNEMTIAKTPAAPDATVGDKIDDASITAQVKSSLLSHHSTSALHTASYNDGWRRYVERRRQKRS